MVRCSREKQELAMTKANGARQSVYESVTEKIAAMIEEGRASYKAPWHVPKGQSALPVNAATHAEYRGINVVSLWIDAQQRGYPTGLWASYRQWQQLGGQVRKGERGSLVVFYKRMETEPAEAEDHDRHAGLRFFAKRSWVFNAAQIEGCEIPQCPVAAGFQRIAEVEAFVRAMNASIHHGFAMARYRHSTDSIEMPDPDWFVATEAGSAEEAYYAVLLHELTHWSGAPHRLNRTFGKRYGDEAYAFEELVAELGAAFMCAMFGISTEPRPDHAGYVASWLKVLRTDSRAIFTAASKAQEAFEHLSYLATRSDIP